MRVCSNYWLVKNFTNPDAFHVECNAICRYPFVVYWLEDIIGTGFIHETVPKVHHLLLEFLGNENLVGQGCEHQVEVIRQFPVFQLRRLTDCFPDAIHVSFEGSL